MRLLILLFCSLLAVIASTDTDTAENQNVLVLTDRNFESEIANIPLVVVMFYVPKVGLDVNSEYNEAGDMTADGNTFNSIVRLAKIHSDLEPKTAELFGIKIFPAFKVFRFGHFSVDYTHFSLENFIAFMKKMASAVVDKEITTVAEAKEITGQRTAKNTAVVGFFPKLQSVDYKFFSEVMNLVTSYGISTYHTSRPSVLESFGFYSNRAAIIMYRPGVKPFKIVYRGTIFKIHLKDWVMRNIVPAFGATYNDDNKDLFKFTGSSYVRFVGTKDDVPVGLMEELSKEYSNLTLAYADKKDVIDEYEKQCDTGNNTDSNVRILATVGSNVRKKSGKTFCSSGDFSADSAKVFIAKFMRGDVKEKPKTQPNTATMGAGKVTTLVGSNFKSLVAGDKAVLIKFYAPWCGHCKTLAPKLEQLASELTDSYEDVMIAKFDSTANAIPDDFIDVYPITGYPTLYYAPYGKADQPILYNGPREVADMKKWIELKLS